MRANGKWELYRETDTTKTEYRLNSATECLKTSRFTESEILICCLIIAGLCSLLRYQINPPGYSQPTETNDSDTDKFVIV